MIHLITGQPGAGKTLYALHSVRQLGERDGRAVYYSGIVDCRVPGWIELDKAEDWHKLPSGSVVVIDEAQRIFRPRGNGAPVPEHVSQLETHRHRGLDLFIVTQHPMLVDSNVRRLVGRHVHVMRSFGMQRATVHEWGTVKEQCDKSREDSNKTEWAYPREAFQLYKSAETHTHKRRLPKRLIFLLLTPLLLGACVFGFYRWYSSFGAAPPAPPTFTGTTSAASGPPEAGRAAPMTTAALVASYVPRIEGLPHTASRYDEITKPTTAPVPVMCIAAESKCRCYSQQGTRLQVPDRTCRSLAETGFFVEFDLKDIKDREQQARTRDTQGRRGSSPAEQNGQPPSVIVAGAPRGIAAPPGDPLRSSGEQGANGGLGQGLVDGRQVSVGSVGAQGGTPNGGPPRPRSSLLPASGGR